MMCVGEAMAVMYVRECVSDDCVCVCVLVRECKCVFCVGERVFVCINQFFFYVGECECVCVCVCVCLCVCLSVGCVLFVGEGVFCVLVRVLFFCKSVLGVG